MQNAVRDRSDCINPHLSTIKVHSINCALNLDSLGKGNRTLYTCVFSNLQVALEAVTAGIFVQYKIFSGQEEQVLAGVGFIRNSVFPAVAKVCCDILVYITAYRIVDIRHTIDENQFSAAGRLINSFQLNLFSGHFKYVGTSVFVCRTKHRTSGSIQCIPVYKGKAISRCICHNGDYLALFKTAARCLIVGNFTTGYGQRIGWVLRVGCGQRHIARRHLKNQILFRQVNCITGPAIKRYRCVRTGFLGFPARKMLTGFRGVGRHPDLTSPCKYVAIRTFDRAAIYRQLIASINGARLNR